MKKRYESLGIAIRALNTDQFESELAKWIGESIRYDNLVVISYFQDRPPSRQYSEMNDPRVLEQFETAYRNGAYLLDPYHTLHTLKSPPGLYRLDEIAPDQFRRNSYYRDYYQNTTMIDEIAYVSYPSDGVSLHISLGRDLSSGQRFSNRELTMAKEIAPVVCSLAERHWSALHSSGLFDDDLVVQNLMLKVEERHRVKLSRRQAQVALMILRGHSSVSIGLQLEISPQTVKVFRKQLYKKCQISSQVELFNMMLPILNN